MDDPRPAESGAPGALAMCGRLLYMFVLLLMIDGCFWFAADFRKFVPPSEGTFGERMHLTVASAFGPFASRFEPEAVSIVLLVAAGVAAAVRGRRHMFWRAVGYVAVLLWFGIGCSLTSLRIT